MRQQLLADLPVSERRLELDGVDTRAVSWLRGLIERTCDEPPVLVGHSVGGALAAHLAIRHPTSVRRIVLVDCSSLGCFRPAAGVIGALVRYGARPSPASRDRFLRQLLFDLERTRNGWGERWPALEAYDIDQATRPSVDAANRQLVLRIGARRIPADQLRAISVPVALVWGTSDRLMRLRIAKKASERFGWPLYPIHECGHGPHIERPDEFLQALTATGTSQNTPTSARRS